MGPSVLPAGLRPLLAGGVEHKSFGPYGLIASPTGADHLQLAPEAYCMASQLDGTRSVASLLDEYGLEAEALLDAMWEGGFLAGAPQRAPVGRVSVTVEGLEFRGFDRVAASIHRRIGRVVFSRRTVPAITVLSAAGLAAFVVQVVDGRPLTVGAATPVVAFVVLRTLGFASVFLHETGHAVVTKHAGRRVGRVGAGFYWGALTFYVDATDTMFCDRRTRMLQAAAGLIVDMVVCGVAAGAALVGGGAVWATVLREVAVLGYLSVLINATPLLQLDGYWFLSDALDRPSLADDSRAALRAALRRRPANGGLVAYRVLAVVFGLLLLAASLGGWWVLFGKLFRTFWNGGVTFKILALLLVMPNAAVVFHLAARLISTLWRHARRSPRQAMAAGVLDIPASGPDHEVVYIK